MGAVDHEGICFPPADDSAIRPDDLPDFLSDSPEHFITITSAIAFIDHMEVIDIHDNGVHGRIFMMLVILLSIPVKILTVIKTCQLIPLCGLDDIPVFRKFYGPAHAGLDHAHSRIGLGDKIDRAKVKALDFRLLLCRGHNNGDPGQMLIFSDFFQHIETGHDRHQDVQKNKGKGILVAFDHGHGLGTIAGKEHFIFILKHLP